MIKDESIKVLDFVALLKTNLKINFCEDKQEQWLKKHLDTMLSIKNFYYFAKYYCIRL